MPIWRRRTVDQREEMVLMWLSGRYIAEEVARRFETTRTTLYEWTRRYRAAGRSGLEDRPPVALECPHKSSIEIEQAALRARDRYGWGPQKSCPVVRLQRP